MLILEPNPPPTSGAMARTRSCPRPVDSAMNVRRMCGFWVDDQMVIASRPGSYQATMPRVSIDDGARRWFTIRCEMVTSASANAFSIALSSTVPLRTPVPTGIGPTQTLLGKSECNTAGSPVIACSGSTTGARRFVVDADRVGRVAGDIAVGRYDYRNRFADVANDGPRRPRGARATGTVSPPASAGGTGRSPRR